MNIKVIFFIIISLSIFITKSLYCQTFKAYHSYRIDGSFPVVEEWNITDTTSHKYLIEETYDSLSRVTSIKFYYNNRIIDIYPMYGVSYITYEYENKIIIERYFDCLGHPLTLFDDESPYRRIYYLDTNNYIDSCKSYFYIEVGELTLKNLNKIEDNVNIWKEVVSQGPIDTTEEDTLSFSNCDMNYVYGFRYSYFKMQGSFPKIKDYKFDYEEFGLIYEKKILDEFIKKY